MRKILSLLLVVMMVFSMTIMASAENTTVLTTTVPDAAYTLNIPATYVIDFGATSTEIAVPTVTDESGFAEGKNLRVSFSYDAFTAPNVSTTIPYTIGYTVINGENYNFPTNALIFEGKTNGVVSSAYPAAVDGNKPHNTDSSIKNLVINVKDTAWGKALGGTYTSTITYSAEVVVE